MKILLAEDNAIARKAVAAGLMADGHDVELAEDGEQALFLAHTTHPDMIISDVLMPNMDGFSLCKAIRADDKLHEIPVVFYSATFLEPEDEELSRLVGASGFVLKDGDPIVFQHKLNAVIESEEAHRSPPYDSNSQHSDVEERLHQKTLISKLLNTIDELKLEKKALQESRQFLNHIVTTIPDVIFVMRLPEQEISYIAPQAERLLGYSSEELMGGSEKWEPIVDDADLERVGHEIRHAVVMGSDAVFTCRMRHKQGAIRWIEGRVSPRLNDSGEAVKLFGALSDVTDHYEQEEQIRQNERRLNTLLANLPGMAYRREDRHAWNMEFVSDGVELLTGYQRDELENSRVLSYADLIHPQDQAMVWKEVQEALDAGRQFSFIYRIIHKDGKVRWVWERGVGVDEEDEHFVEGFISDITLRKQAEEKLVNSEKRFRNLFEMMTSGMAVHELIYDQKGKAVDYRFLEVNPAYEQLLGIDAKRVIGHSVRKVIPDIDEGWIKDYIHVAKSGQPAGFVRYYAPLDKYYQVIAYRTQEDQFATIVTDVSEQHGGDRKV